MPALFANFARARGFFSSSITTSSAAKRRGRRKPPSSKEMKGNKNGKAKSQNDTEVTGRNNVKGGKVTKRVDIPSSSTKAKKASNQRWNFFDLLNFFERPQICSNGESLGGETLMEDEPSIKCEGETEGEVTIVVEEELLKPIDGESDAFIPFQDVAFQPGDERIQDWSDDEIWIFNKLVMRGQEPLVPYELASEFPSWPDVLFSKDQDRVVIRNISRSTTNRAYVLPAPKNST